MYWLFGPPLRLAMTCNASIGQMLHDINTNPLTDQTRHRGQTAVTQQAEISAHTHINAIRSITCEPFGRGPCSHAVAYREVVPFAQLPQPGYGHVILRMGGFALEVFVRVHLCMYVCV